MADSIRRRDERLLQRLRETKALPEEMLNSFGSIDYEEDDAKLESLLRDRTHSSFGTSVQCEDIPSGSPLRSDPNVVSELLEDPALMRALHDTTGDALFSDDPDTLLALLGVDFSSDLTPPGVSRGHRSSEKCGKS